MLRRVMRYAIERGRLLADPSELLAQSLDDTTSLQRLAELLVRTLLRYCAIDLPDEASAVRRIAEACAGPRTEVHRLFPALGEVLEPNSPQPV
jgi:hypothetical protein